MLEAKWFGQYMNLAANNVVGKDGKIRFSYTVLREALDAIESEHKEQVPHDVSELFSKITWVLPKIDMDARTEKTLLLALINCHMEFILINGYLFEKEVQDIKEEIDEEDDTPKDDLGFDIY